MQTNWVFLELQLSAAAAAATQSIVLEPIESFLPATEAAIAQKDVKAINEFAYIKIDHFLQSVHGLPRESFDKVYNYNANTLHGSRLPDALKQSAVTYLNKLKNDYCAQFDKAVGEKTTAINNYKVVLRNVQKDREFREKFFDQAPIILQSMNAILFDLSENLKQILATFVDEVYAISVDTLVNGAMNWRKRSDGGILWLRPAEADQLVMPMEASAPADSPRTPLNGPIEPLPGSVPAEPASYMQPLSSPYGYARQFYSPVASVNPGFVQSMNPTVPPNPVQSQIQLPMPPP